MVDVVFPTPAFAGIQTQLFYTYSISSYYIFPFQYFDDDCVVFLIRFIFAVIAVNQYDISAAILKTVVLKR